MCKYLVCYDISEPRRLQRVHRYVSNEAEFLQKSVYKLSADNREFEKFVVSLENIINSKTDDVRIYPLSPSITIEIWGRHNRPSGIHILG